MISRNAKSSHLQWSIIIAIGSLIVATAQHDFQFENANNEEDLQLVFTEPVEQIAETVRPTKNTHYEKELSQCPHSESKILLSLVLKSQSWSNIVDNKKTKAVNKLSRFFMIPKNFFHFDDISRRDIYEMVKYSSSRGPSAPNVGSGKKVGRIEFVVGCDNELFPTGKLIANQIAEQMKDGTIADISGLDFEWWSVNRRRASNRVPRTKRETEGSGEDEYDEYYDEEDEDEEEITEVPTVSTHAHRHHGDTNILERDSRIGLTKTVQTHGGPHIQLVADSTAGKVLDNLDPDIRESVSILESEISKTIENNMSKIKENEEELEKILESAKKKKPTGIFPDTYNVAEESDNDDFITPIIETIPEDEQIEIIKKPLPTPSTLSPSTQRHTTQLPVTLAGKKGIEDDYVIEDVSHMRKDGMRPRYGKDFDTTAAHVASTTVTTEISRGGGEDVWRPVTKASGGHEVKAVTSSQTASESTEVTTKSTFRDSQTTPSTPLASTESTQPEQTSTSTSLATTEWFEPEAVNKPPVIRNRLPKQALTAGKPFSLHVPLETFYDDEDRNNLQLALYDKNDHPLKANSWIQFNVDTREIYGLPLEDAVSRWQYRLHATDSIGQSVTETLDISVQQHKSHRSANHEISIGIRLNEKFSNSVDWQMKVVRGIVSAMGDANMNSVIVREIRHSQQDPNSATFVYTNETLPKDRCSEEELENLVKRLHTRAFSDALLPEIALKSVTGQPIGPCQKQAVPKAKPTPTISKNFPPVPRNQVDRVNATVGQLLIFQVPQDTFYDPEDGTNLRLSLLSLEGSKLDAKHWLQFDSKNQEFYGIPKPADVGQREYLLVAEDREGLTATDALVVVVNHAPKRDYSALFEMTLGISNDNFNNSATQRRFIERVAQVFGDVSTANIQVRSIRALHHSGHTLVSFYNTTIYRLHHMCPHDEIEVLRNVLMHSDASVRNRVRDTIGTEFNLLSVNLIPAGTCQGTDTTFHDPFVPIKTEDKPAPTFKDDYLLTFVLPAVIILAMLLLASIIACVLHRRRLTGKMELGDEEERRSFRSKGIPVIFQDELDEKPEIGNKSPVILKDEKPPLLPPSYNSTNPDGDNEDVDEYVPPPAVIIGGRESRGKSPVTPSYRKPPPYVSP
ncbi:uncharacterized protein LOC132257147 [Phlebotomus argentipes]|uniref:uncharacterized protein LOC132257147 n=1 Tax=Phlebotomus argentipes TaxID=94469 RepID=UPI0028931E4D|nr:uncharacterized protein LOC132257147 [Phlebotomus argentipes]